MAVMACPLGRVLAVRSGRSITGEVVGSHRGNCRVVHRARHAPRACTFSETVAVDTVWPVLAGRDPERAAIAALLDAARAGSGGALVVRGVAGSGKSALLADALCGASGTRVLRTSGVESESPLAFAALQRLLWPLRAHLDVLPDPQRAALRAALGVAAGEGDRFLAFLGTLSLLAEAAEEAPVLAVVDDAHWLDDASAAALLFVARRLQAERVALLFAARDGDVRRFEADDLPTVVLGGVTGSDADALLSARAGGVSTPWCATGWSRRPAATHWRWWSWSRCSAPSSWPAGSCCRRRCR